MENMAIETDYAKEFENVRKRCLELEERSKKDEMRHLMLEIEVENLKKKNQELEGQIAAIQKVVADSTYAANDGQNLYEVMVENKVLELEKRTAETAVCFWKDKCKELECNMKGMNENSQVRSAKRKRNAKIIDSDDDDDSYDDNAPICILKARHVSTVMTNSEENSNSEEEVKETVSRRHLTRLRNLESKKEQDNSIVDLNKTFSSSEDEEDDCVDESLGGFIVDSSESTPECDSAGGCEDVVNEYKLTLEKIGRKRSSNLKWDLEGDMLSDFAKDPELCMRAVCALYRQQTDDEKECKGTIHQNGRGFSQPDAYRGCELAEFLVDGDPYGDLNKTVEELREYDSEGIEDCKKLAKKYSNQLFTIYQNKEDPYFLPK